MPGQYYLKNIRALLRQGFDETHLRRLCYDHFRPVYDQLAEGTGKDVIIDRLIQYAGQTLSMEQLLALAKAENPAQYEAHQPYDRAGIVAKAAEVEEGLVAHEKLRGLLPEAQFKAIAAELQAMRAELEAWLRESETTVQGEQATAIQQGDQSQAIVGSQVGRDVVGPGSKVAGEQGVVAETIHGPVATGAGSRAVQTGTYIETQVVGRPSGPDPASLRTAYLNRVFESSSRLSLAGIDPKAASSETEARLNLGAVYTALLTLTPEQHERFALGPKPPWESRQLSALAQLNRQGRLVLLGDPGSGKSTFVNFVAMCLAGEMLGQAEANLKRLTAPLPNEKGQDEKKRQPWRHGPLLPVRIILRDFAAQGLPPAGAPATAEHLWGFIEADLKKAALADYARPLAEELRQQGGLLLLDGLDEVPEAHRRRTQIKQAIEDFAAAFPRCRILVTSRTYAYQKQEWRLPDFGEAILAPFSPGQMRRFIERWYGHLAFLRGLNEADAQGRAELLKRAIFSSDRLLALAERPLLLTLMASLHAWRGGSLPEKREELYADTVDLLLDWWESPKTVRDAQGQVMVLQPSLAEWLKVDREKVRAQLNHLAYAAHAAQEALVGTADVDEGRLVSSLMRLSQNPEVNPARLVEYLSQRAGLLLPRGVGVYTFPHRTFQEYLAACHLTGPDYPDEIAELARQEPNRWREVALLAGAKAARGTASAIWALVEALCYRGPEDSRGERADVWGALLAGQALVETTNLGQLSERHEDKVKRVKGWLVNILAGSDLPAVERATAGATLAHLGDPREGVTTLDGVEFCLVPAGPFWMGSEEDDDEKPLHQVDLPYDYWLARCPVTVAQFRAFVEASGRRPQDKRSLQGLDNHPVVYVTWHEALAFCRWLAERWQAQGILPSGWQVTLPSEAEWEKAARGGLEIPASPLVRSIGAAPGTALTPNPQPQRRYPWGDEADPNRANYDDTGLGQTSPVGCFSGGASPYGCLDMSGNVWEWTRSLDRKYPYDPQDGREDLKGTNVRVLRGGSWSVIRGRARCAVRVRGLPAHRGSNIGVRVLVSPI